MELSEQQRVYRQYLRGYSLVNTSELEQIVEPVGFWKSLYWELCLAFSNTTDRNVISYVAAKTVIEGRKDEKIIKKIMPSL